MQRIFSRWREQPLFGAVLVLIITVLLAEAAYYVVFLNTWFDEVEYTYKAWLTAEGLGQPYLDFRIKHGPIGFYAEVLWQELFGPTLFGARVLSALLLGALAALLYDIARRLWGRGAALFALAALALNPYLVGYYVSAVPYALAMLPLLFSVWLLLAFGNGTRGLLFATAAMTAAVLVRYNLLPALIILWLYFFFTRGFRAGAQSVFASLGFFALGFLPYALLDLEYASVWFLQMLGPWFVSLVSPGYAALNSEFALSSPLYFFDRGFLEFLARLTTKYFPLFALFGAGVTLALLQPFSEFRRLAREHAVLALIVGAALALGVAHFLTPAAKAQGSLLHALYFMPLVILAAAGFLALFIEKLRAHGAWLPARRSVVAVCAVTLLLAMPTLALEGPDIIFFNHFDGADTDLARAARGGAFIAEHTASSDVILSLDSPHALFLAGRAGIPALINLDFTAVDHPDETLVRRFALYTAPMLLNWLRNDATVVLFQREGLADRSVLLTQDGEPLRAFQAELARRYTLVGTIEGVYPRKYAHGEGIMELYRRK